jgi:hypothetical protein
MPGHEPCEPYAANGDEIRAIRRQARSTGQLARLLEERP